MSDHQHELRYYLWLKLSRTRIKIVQYLKLLYGKIRHGICTEEEKSDAKPLYCPALVR